MNSPNYAPPPITMAPPPPPVPPQRSVGGVQRVVLLVVIGLAVVVGLVASLVSTASAARKIAFPKPVVSIASNTSNARVGDPLTFSAVTVAGRDLIFTWDFGDGVGATGATVTHNYSDYQQNGYTVTVTATDPLHQSASATKDISILPGLPTAAFTYTTDPSGPLTIDFDASGSTGANLSYQWDFGDSNSDNNGQDIQTSNTYAHVGTYQVTLTVTDVANQTASISKQVTIQITGPVASFTATQTYNDGYGDACYTFDASASSGYQLTYEWDFGDSSSDSNGSSQESHCYYTYGSGGSYQVTLTVVDGVNQSSTTRHYVSF